MAERPAEDKSGILPETSIFFYGIPAYGHLHSNLYLTGCLSAAGYRVVYYSMEPYRREIKANGCEFRAYPLDRDSIDASDGDKPLKLYRLILEYTRDMLPHLLAEAEKEKPCHIRFSGPVGQGCGRNHEDTFMQLLQHCGHGPCRRESILGICIRVLSLFSPVCGRI